jgi:hypothetical protein
LHELIIGTLNEGWIAGRKADQREFYVYFDQKSAHLLEINGMKERERMRVY